MKIVLTGLDATCRQQLRVRNGDGNAKMPGLGVLFSFASRHMV